MLRAFGHRVATCCDMLAVVGSSLKLVKFEPTTPNMSQHGGQTLATCCVGMLRSFGQGFTFCTRALMLQKSCAVGMRNAKLGNHSTTNFSTTLKISLPGSSLFQVERGLKMKVRRMTQVKVTSWRIFALVELLVDKTIFALDFVYSCRL